MITVRLTNIAGTEIYLPPFESVQWTEELNKGVDGRLSMSYQALSDYAVALKSTANNVISSAFRKLQILKDDSVIFTGAITSRQISGGQTGATSISVTFADYLVLLGKRRTASSISFTSEDSSDIAWSLINTTQGLTNGNLGITRGYNPTTKNRDRTFVYDNVRDEIVKMSNEKVKDGYDFDIDANLQFNVYYPTKGASKPEIVFDDFNIIGFNDNMKLAGNLTNRAIVIGKLENVTRENTTPMSSWYVHEDTVSAKDIETTAYLNDRGDAKLALEQQPSDTETLTITHIDERPSIDDYDVGDSVQVRIDAIGKNSMMRVKQRSIDYNGGKTTVTITLE